MITIVLERMGREGLFVRIEGPSDVLTEQVQLQIVPNIQSTFAREGWTKMEVVLGEVFQIGNLAQILGYAVRNTEGILTA